MKASNIIYLTDRSSAEMDDTCGMKYWWNKKACGQGIVSVHESIYLTTGREVHEDFAALAMLDNLSPNSLQSYIDEHMLAHLTDEDRENPKTMEHVYRRAGWFAAWGLFIEPQIRDEFEHVSVEGEIIFDRNPLWVAVTPDRVLRHRRDGYVVYKEFKSTITAQKKWLDSWSYAIQLHLGMKALEEELKEKVRFAQIIGLMKGSEGYGDNPHLSHPYVWAWYNASTKKWTSEYSQARSAQWEKMPVWEFDGGIVQWVIQCGEDTARSQFPHTGPVFLNDHMLNQWIEERTTREMLIADARGHDGTLWDMGVFPHSLKNCRPAFGDACDYQLACWNATVGANPLASGEYIKRTPHHHMEVVLREQGVIQ